MDGVAVSLRHFVVTGLNREDVWLDSAGIPVMFRSFEDGTPIDFVLQNALGAAAAASLGAKTHQRSSPHPAPARISPGCRSAPCFTLP